jgi:hypothetical protein
MNQNKNNLGETMQITAQTFHSYDLLQIYIDRARLHGILDRLARSSHWMCSSVSFYIAAFGFFIPLVTADFRSIGGIDGNLIRLGVVGLTITCGLAGTISLIAFFANRSKWNVDRIIEKEILRIDIKSNDV